MPWTRTIARPVAPSRFFLAVALPPDPDPPHPPPATATASAAVSGAIALLVRTILSRSKAQAGHGGPVDVAHPQRVLRDNRGARAAGDAYRRALAAPGAGIEARGRAVVVIDVEDSPVAGGDVGFLRGAAHAEALERA